MTVKAKLRVQLLAEEVVVAESEDPALWQRVLAAIQGPAAALPGLVAPPPAGKALAGEVPPGTDPAVANFAAELGLEVPVVLGACAPSREEPFLHLDQHHWEALKKSTPTRGPGSISPAALGGTLSALWAKHAGLGPPSMKIVSAVLATIHLRDQNIARSLANCEWLQVRGGNVVINPARTSSAVALGTAFCSKQAPAWPA